MGCGSSKSNQALATTTTTYTRPPVRETTILRTSDLQHHAADHNLPLDEVNVLWLRFKLLGPTGSGLVSACAFDSNVGTGFRHNAILSKFVKTKYLDDDTLDFDSFIRLLKWWKLADTAEKVGCTFDLYDHDEDNILTIDETKDLLRALCHGGDSSAAMQNTILHLVTEEDDETAELICKKSVFLRVMEEFDELHHDLLSVSDRRVFDSTGEQKSTGIMRQKTRPKLSSSTSVS
mmetsp:Transcript_31504/g.82650  ORF Transcript_31504/g.82650 Transcript_31504/m.82650 type:complete len:234 (+) Transcript_31504:304-1005(+)